MTAIQYFEDGNRLFRDDLYYAALLRYEQASQAGLDTPLLHFNTGVAHYHARQHVRARDSLTRALSSPELAPLVQYNLGLNAHAAGNEDEALRWLRLARDQSGNDRIARYAEAAIGRIRGKTAIVADVVDEEADEEPRVEEPRELSRLALDARVSFGTDSNPFRTPAESYIDFADPDEPVVVPIEQSGAFMPVNLGARYQVNPYDHEGFFGAYRLDGRYYQDKELENASEYLHEVSFGSEYRRRNEERGRERRLYTAFRIGQRDQVYYDPDNGGGQIVNDVDVSDRFNYVRYGPELSYRQFHDRFGFGIRGRAEIWNYDAVEEVPEYDHEFFLLSTYGQFKISPTSMLRLTATGHSRQFNDRLARDADGSIDRDNELLKYTYLEARVTALQQIGSKFWFSVDYERRQREDDFVGYADYTRDSYGAEFRFGLGARLDLTVAGYYRLYDFPNAFAFHNPDQGAKTLESQDIDITASYRMTRTLFLVLEAAMQERVSTDARIEYERSQFVLGVHWRP
ncbi:MAG: hypothetical protein AAFX10_10660 [Pseudomonadota bacterium]